jgi:hypothetical protein
MVKHKRNRVANETAVRKRMMEYTSQIMIFYREREQGHEGCQTSQRFRDSAEQEKKRDTELIENSERGYRYANCALKHCFANSTWISQARCELV